MSTAARILSLAGAIALLGLAAAIAPAGAHVAPPPTVDVQPFAGLAPDAGSIAVQVLASCPERWTVAEAVVTVSQPGVSGQAPFRLSCTGSLQSFFVSVEAAAGSFQLGDALVSSTVVISRGRTVRADDSQVVVVDPTVLVELAETARLESGGAALVLDVTVACPAGTNGLPSGLVVSQGGRTIGSNTYVPSCDGLPHTFAVRVEADKGVYEPGIAQALTSANIEFAGQHFSGIDDDGALELLR